MKIQDNVINRVIEKILLGKNYRIEIHNLINAEFLEYVVSFFKKVAEAKINNKIIDIQWYKNVFLCSKNSPVDIAINAGLNKKSITNMCKTATKKVVIDIANEHIDSLLELINDLSVNNNDIDLELTIRFRGISVHLNINESLLVINTIAVKRAAIRGGLWSAVGKNAEKGLMLAVCQLFNVPKENFILKNEDVREVDFYFLGKENKYKCEIKLMGKGNPESADAVIARDSHIFIADTLSTSNKIQLESLSVEWIELSSDNGILKFNEVFKKLSIPYVAVSSITSDKIRSIKSKIYRMF